MALAKGRRLTVAVLAAVTALGVSVVVAYRMLAPADVVTPATQPYPAAVTPKIGTDTRLAMAPLIVDDRLRVYATTRQVWADHPVDARTRRTAFWSLRRWPAEVSGVAAGGTTVLTRWSDGELVALDARTGEVAWRVTGPKPTEGYTGRLTGAETVYAPPGLHLATDAASGRVTAVVAGGGELAAYDLADGRQLWRASVDDNCRGESFTTAGGQLALIDTCAQPRAIELRDLSTGQPIAGRQPDVSGTDLAVTPVGCRAAGSDCTALRVTAGGQTQGWRVDGETPVAVAALDAPGSVLVGDAVVGFEGTDLVVRSAQGAERWRKSAPDTTLLAAADGRVHLRTAGNDLVTFELNRGRELSRFPLTMYSDDTGWEAGYVQAVDGYVVVERLNRADPDLGDRAYYLGAEPVLIAVTGR